MHLHTSSISKLKSWLEEWNIPFYTVYKQFAQSIPAHFSPHKPKHIATSKDKRTKEIVEDPERLQNNQGMLMYN